MKRLICTLCLIASVFLFSGCMRTTDEMYRVPKRSDSYYNLQSAIDAAISGQEYCAPRTGENQQNVQMADLDGDGESEYLVFTKNTQERPLRILVFRNDGAHFSNTDTVEFNGTAFDQVEYVDMDGDGGAEIIVGRQLSDQLVRMVSVFKLAEDGLQQLITVNYTKYLTTDLDNNKHAELFIIRPGQTDTDNGVAELYSMKNGNIERYNEVSLSQPPDKLKRIIIGKLDGGSAAVYSACAAGETSLVTDVFALRNGMLTNVALSNESGTAVQTMRNFYVYADDIDNDSVVELPHLMIMKPLEDMSLSNQHHLIRWYAMTPDGAEVDKMCTYHDFVGGWYMQLQSEWASRVVVRNIGNQYDFFIWDEEYKETQLIISVYAITVQNRDASIRTDDYILLHKTDTMIYAAELHAAAYDYGIDQDSLKYSFRLIQKDWKTGET